MSGGWLFFGTTVAVYILTAMIACWGLNLQFGETGILNFSFIVFEAIGAYTCGVLTLGPSSGNGGFQHYIFGANLPFPIPWIVAMMVGALFSLIIGVLVLRRLRGDYQAMVMLVISLVGTYVVSADKGLFNGSNGLALVPAPFSSVLGSPGTSETYRLFYTGLSLVVCVGIWLVVRRLTSSPYGRVLRAIRENDEAAAALGKNVMAYRLSVFMIGGALGALAGAMLVQLIGAWSPGSWLYPETFTLFAAVIIGGRGNTWGVAAGAALVPGLFLEGVLFLPSFGPAYLVGALQWIVVGVAIIAFMWFRPQGVIPERRRTFDRSGASLARLRPSAPVGAGRQPVQVGNPAVGAE